MSIRSKAIATVSAALTLVIGVLCWLVGGTVESGFAEVERRAAVAHMQRTREVLLGDVGVLCEKTGDWAQWDDAYTFAVDRNPEFLATNLTATAFETLKIDLILMFDVAGKPLISLAHDGPGAKTTSPPQALLQRHFAPGSGLIRYTTESNSHRGLLVTPGLPPAIFCSVAVVTSEGEGPVRGSMVFGRFLRDRERKHAADTLKLDVAFALDDDKGGPFDVAAAMRQLPKPDSIAVVAASESFLDGYTRFVDSSGNHSLVVRARIPREIHRQAGLTQRYVAIALLGVGLLALIVVVAMLEFAVLRRVVGLTKAVTEITETADFARRVSTRGSDEVASLGQSINGFLAAVEQVLGGAVHAEAKYNVLIDLEETAAAVVELAPEAGQSDHPAEAEVVMVYEPSPAFLRQLGWGEDAVGQPLSLAPRLAAKAASEIGLTVQKCVKSGERQRLDLDGGDVGPLSVCVAPLGGARVLLRLGTPTSGGCVSRSLDS